MCSIRHADRRLLAILSDNSPAGITEELVDWGVLNADARQAVGH